MGIQIRGSDDSISASPAGGVRIADLKLNSKTTAGRDAGIGTATATTIFNSTTKAFQIWTGSLWQNIFNQVDLDVIEGKILVSTESTLTFRGDQFGSTGNNITVNFSDGVSLNEDITGAITTQDRVGVVTVTSAVYNNVTSGESISVKIITSDGKESKIKSVRVVTPPVGGDTTTSYGNYVSHSFTSSGSFVVDPSYPVTVDYLIVAGGGGGGNANGGGGGGGAGGMRTGTVNLSGGTYPVQVGTGGAGVGANTNAQGTPGNDSTFYFVTSTGGGGGGGEPPNSTQNGLPGGSGGGGGRANGNGGSGTTGQGNPGGTSVNNSGGGGGGASQTGTNAQPEQGGAGGNGLNNAYANGSNVVYAGGGGGGCENGTPNTFGNGGNGGGGNGGAQNNSSSGPLVQANDGTDGLGGGGGGGADTLSNVGTFKAGDGGDGIVVIRYNVHSS